MTVFVRLCTVSVLLLELCSKAIVGAFPLSFSPLGGGGVGVGGGVRGSLGGEGGSLRCCRQSRPNLTIVRHIITTSTREMLSSNARVDEDRTVCVYLAA